MLYELQSRSVGERSWRVLANRSQSMSHRAMTGNETRLFGSQPRARLRIAEINCMYRRMLPVSVLHQASRIIEVAGLTICGLQLRGKMPVADQHVALGAIFPVPRNGLGATG